jgi:trehalose 6-phosphate synthase/phosphatase
MSGRIIIVSNRLPLSIVKREGRWIADRSIGGLATALSSVFGRYEPIWVGWTGVKKVFAQKEMASLGLPDGLVPVQIPARMVQRYYDRYCNRVLWPELHGLRPGIKVKGTDWQAYEEMSERFAAAASEQVRPGDLIWIHDFHLMLLPHYLRKAGVKNRIGFFLHTPFPAKSGLEHQPLMLKSLMSADLVGLQTDRDVKNIRAAGFNGNVRAIPIGIDYKLYSQADKRDNVRSILSDLKARTKKRKMILSISRLDQTKGIVMQLRAVEDFLRGRGDRKNFVYRVIVAPSRENVPEFKKLRVKVERVVEQINQRLGSSDWRPVDYEYRSIGLDEVCAHDLAGDIMLLAPVIDGMNLIAKEYVATRTNDRGMLVLSNTAGAAFNLKDAVLVDPLSRESIVAGLHQAQHMGAKERSARWEKMRRAVAHHDLFWWTDEFIRTLRASS